MTGYIARAGDFGGDFSGLRLNNPKLVQQAVDAKCRLFLRYSAGVGNVSPGSQWKLCGASEIPYLTNSGFDFCANSEWYETRVLEGSAAGSADGAADLLFWRSRGYNRGGVIIVSADCPVPRLKYPYLAAYLHAYQEALGNYYLVGLYAGTPVLQAMKKRGLIRSTWRPNAGDWSKDGLPYQPSRSQVAMLLPEVKKLGIDIWQTGNYMFNKQMDEIVVVTDDLPTHNRALSHPLPKPQPKKPPKPKPNVHPRPILGVVKYRVKPSDSDGLAAICRRHHISNWRRVAKINKISGPDFTVRVGEILRLPGILPAKSQPTRKVVYRVQAGDTLWRIAQRWGADLEAVKQANTHAGHPIGNLDNLQPGDLIVHP